MMIEARPTTGSAGIVVETRPLELTLDLAAEIAAFDQAFDERDAHTPEEYVEQQRLWGADSRSIVLRRAGSIVGSIGAGFGPGGREQRRAWCGARWSDVVPLELVERETRMALEWAGPTGTIEFTAWVYADHVSTLALWRSLGFEQIGTERFLRRDLVEMPLPEPIELAGIEITTLADRPEFASPAYQLWADGIRSIPGEEDTILSDFDHWQQLVAGSIASPASSRYLGVRSGEVVAYCSIACPPARPDIAQHGLLAVRSDARGQGIGRMFKHFTIHRAAEAGKRWLETDNAEGNEVILHLNQSLGFEETTPMLKLRLAAQGERR